MQLKRLKSASNMPAAKLLNWAPQSVAMQLDALLTAGKCTRDDAFAHKVLKARLQEGSEDAWSPAHHQQPCLGLERQ